MFVIFVYILMYVAMYVCMYVLFMIGLYTERCAYKMSV